MDAVRPAMSKRSFVRSVTILFALTLGASAFAAPITRIPLLPKQILATMPTGIDQPARGYRDVSVRFGARSDVTTRAVPAR
jgi:hypothetical protein